MGQATRILGTAVATAAGMYWLDPVSGRRRRAELGQQLTSALGDLQRAVGVGGRDLAHRAQGVAARTRAAMDREPVLDAVLVERVRSRLGRAVSHPHAIEVTAQDGRVSLKGAVLAVEYPGLMRALWSVAGVRAIEDQLAVHEAAGDIPALQGSARASGAAELSPGARLLASAAGCVLLVLGVGQRSTIGALGAIAGGALIVGGASHFSLERLSEGLIDTLQKLGDASRTRPRRRRASVRAHLRRAAPTLSPAPGLAADPGQALR